MRSIGQTQWWREGGNWGVVEKRVRDLPMSVEMCIFAG